MAHALEQADDASQLGEVPVGAVLVDAINGKTLSLAGNGIESLNDPTAHAEILVIREAASQIKQTRLENCDLYVTLEPCAMCAMAISLARIRRLYFGAYDPKYGAVDHGPRIFQGTSCHHHPEVYGGINERASQKLLRAFFKERR